ncbi:MAG: Periplasmic thiol:disulfide oxidoreductase DsbB, required for DsbA reoxidation [Burkholderiaceae bacterium]|jgi:disulfide bond formation protein DsbB|nr:MAG: Periplasmic thiol:disulfide oxidoreductase DsbB, required for DsbA reoxidation [Burkholderiaceae bacterium]
MLLNWFDAAPRRVLAAICVVCIALLAFAVYLQQVGGLEPCPMCIVQRYAFILIAIIAGVTAASKRKGLQIGGAVLLLVAAGAGAFVAARQSWLQWHPPEYVSCGRDLYGMIANFPLSRAVPMIFRGSGDCSKVDWTFLGGSVANWSFLWLCAIALASLTLIVRRVRSRA